MDRNLFVMQADLCKAIAHPTRIEILQLLREGERCVCEIHPALGIDQPNASRHLAVLKKEGILSSRKEGLKMIYRVNDQKIFDLLELVTAMLKEHWSTKTESLAQGG